MVVSVADISTGAIFCDGSWMSEKKLLDEIN